MATASTTLSMAEHLVPDEIWAAIQPLLPPKPPYPKGGRPWIEDRAVLGGIIYVLRAGVPWRLLPAKRWFHNGWSLRAQTSAQARCRNACRMSARRS